MMVVLLSALTFNGNSFAKEQIVKDPFGTKCATSELTETVSVSNSMSKSQLPKEWSHLKGNKKYVAIQVRKLKPGTKEEHQAMEKYQPGDSYFVSNFFYIEAMEAKKINLKKGDLMYCLASVSYEDGDAAE